MPKIKIGKPPRPTRHRPKPPKKKPVRNPQDS
jgi:hypothetical protein